MPSVIQLSSEIAQLLDSDPVLAKSVIGVLGAKRAIELFELYPLNAVIEQEAVSMGEDQVIQRCVADVPLSLVLAAYRRAGRIHS